MERIETLAIILRAVPFQDRDRIVTALTADLGKVSAMARNAVQSRRFGGSLDPLVASQWHLTKKAGSASDLLHLDSTQPKRDFAGIRQDFDKFSIASFWSELLLKLVPENEPLPDLFRLHANALAALEESRSGPRNFALLSVYLGKFLQLNGTAPQLQACLGCGRSLEEIAESSSTQIEVRAEAEAGGWSCRSCERQSGTAGFDHLKVATLFAFREALDHSIKQASELESLDRLNPDFFEFLKKFCAFHVPGFDLQSFKTLRFVSKK